MSSLVHLRRHIFVWAVHQAGRLRFDERAGGDHGFQGAQLAAWEEQREALQQALGRVFYGGAMTVGDVTDATGHPCPRNAYPGMGLLRTRGTDGGSDWVSECGEFLLDFAYTLADVRELEQAEEARENVEV